MANNKKKPAPKSANLQKAKVPLVEVSLKKTSLSGISFKTQCIILAVISFLLYANSIGNEYALDDGIVIINNQYVQHGVSGIGKIMSNDAYASYYEEMHAGQMLAGGRYRPLSIVVFAIEQSIFNDSAQIKYATAHHQKPTSSLFVVGEGTYWHIKHFISVLFYVALILTIFYFLSRFLFKKLDFGEDMAFVATLLFAIHPMHTEVVANVKSLDEIMSLLLIILTCIFSLRFFEKDDGKKQPMDIIFSLVFYFGALLAKEYAITMIAALPILFYVVLRTHPAKILVYTLPYAGIAILYLFVRFKSVGIAYNPTAEELSNHTLFTEHMNRISLLMKLAVCAFTISVPLFYRYIQKTSTTNAVLNSLPFVLLPLLYLAAPVVLPKIPVEIPQGEILNNPYMNAVGHQKAASEIFVLGKYLYMLFVPYPLASDYSYNQIPYHDFSDFSVILCILIYAGLAAWGLYLLWRKNILAFAVFFYLFNLAMVSNFLVDIGATMGERLAFHSSLGFIIIITYGLFYLTRKMEFKTRKNALLAVIVPLFVASSAICIPRNAEWKNDVTLFTKDVNTVPNSAMVLGNAGARYIDLAEKAKDPKQSDAYVRQSINYLAKSVSLYKGYVNSYLNLGVAYYKLDQPDSARMCWEYAKKLYPTHPNLHMYLPLLGQSYLHKAMDIGKNGNLVAAIAEMKKGLPYAPNDPSIYYNIGGAFYTIHQFDSARAYWTKALQINPNYVDARRGMAALPPANK